MNFDNIDITENTVIYKIDCFLVALMSNKFSIKYKDNGASTRKIKKDVPTLVSISFGVFNANHILFRTLIILNLL